MDNLLLKYMDQRFHKHKESHLKSKKPDKGSGPVITISRQFGCQANYFAENLQTALHELDQKQRWEKVNKEILETSAKELNLALKKIKYVFDSEQITTMDEIMKSMFTKYYKSDRVIRKTIINTIKEYAHSGNKIIVGRAGVAIAYNLEKSFHIRLIAPLEWRADLISKKYNYSNTDAIQLIHEIDYKRLALIEKFYGGKFDDSIFDIVFNVSSIPSKEAIQSCLPILKAKGII